MTMLDLHTTGRDLWQDHANCRGEDPEFMQPERASDEDVELAKSVCIGCPVFAKCQESAESQGADPAGEAGAYGVWAGEWWGSPPKQAAQPCKACGAELEAPATGRAREFCDATCRQRHRRAQKDPSRVVLA